MTLADIGFDAESEQAFAALAVAPGFAGRVTRIDADLAQLVTDSGETTARVPRRVVRVEPGRPVTGDWVACSASAEPVVSAVLPRRSELVRRAAGRRARPQVLCTNVDVLFVVMGLDGDFNLRRLERYLTLAADGRMKPVVLLTKAGLCADPAARAAEARGVACEVDVYAIDVLAGIETCAPARHLGPGITAAAVGSSGAGKSTLVNFLMGSDRMRVDAVRAHDDRGKHTTTHRELMLLPQGGAIIDTPGMRELGLWAEGEALETAFPDVIALSSGCRFRDCRHQTEPGCALRAAVEKGGLDAARLASYIALGKELERRSNDTRRG